VTPTISLKGIGKKYRITSSKSLRLREILSFGKKQHSQDFWALQDIDLEIEQGSTLGILGRNGAGKSTMLQIISGVLQPTTGTVEVNGRLIAIFGLGSGFNPEFTGRENAMMNGLILGIDRHEMLERFEEIEAFADIGDFMDHPVKTYSSGMKSRLGFAVAVNVEPNILVIDEALSAGDASFKKKALQRMYDLRDSGTTVLFVSHSMGMVNRFCTEAVLLNRGHMIARGTPDEVLGEYRSVLENSQSKKDAKNAERDQQLDYAIAHEDEDDMPDPPKGKGKRGQRRPTGEAEVLDVKLLDEDQQPADRVPSGSNLTVRVRARYAQAVDGSAFGAVLRDRSGTLLFATSTDMEEPPLGARAEGEVVTVDFAFGAPFRPGHYGVEATVSGDAGRVLGRTGEPATFEVVAEERPAGDVIQPPTRVEVYDHEELGPAT
jgi:ABC-type polysaccharide/polyol phosphate transport system ATPase subunit